ncbi:DegT/DnrJ/EryC1/StrS family aminotransferase [Trinickia sp. LjRoot230]|uniref:DegT/DnrJ/EryC1/StrS family aminotransferase n=1 Tax=Trinickia sp. LjRoot230 TaxID=3342288 RepID=UPI003ECC8533
MNAYFRISTAPAFATPLRLGQHNLPSWERFETAMRGIFERRYYTNQGPLTRAFEERLQAFLNVRHAVCVTNATIGLMMASEALGVGSHAVVPAIGTRALEHALRWCGVAPVHADVDPASGQLDVARLASACWLDEPGAIVGANLWGDACDAAALAALAHARGVPLMLDSSHAMGCMAAGKRPGAFAALEVFSFDAEDIVNAGGGACVATDDDELAARLRNIRSSYGAGRPVSVVKTSNGRMSEAQAALGLLTLEDFEANRARNHALFEAYESGLRMVRGVRVVAPAGVQISNHQTVVCALDAGAARDALVAALAQHNIEARAIGMTASAGASASCKRSADIASSWLTLPVGAHVDAAAIARVCEVIDAALAQGAHREGAAA